MNIINTFAAATSSRFQISRLRNEIKILSSNNYDLVLRIL